MAAIAAGMHCIAVATGTTTKADLKKLKPNMVVEGLEDIVPLAVGGKLFDFK